MELNEIKKGLYRLKPFADRIRTEIIDGETYHTYQTWVIPGPEGRILFKIPQSEMGEVVFKDIEPAQLLIRWLSHD